MRRILNIVWFVIGGIPSFLAFFIAGIFSLITIIGIPLAFQQFKMAETFLHPFGRKVVQKSSNPIIAVCNIIWFIFFGLWFALGMLSLALASFVSIIGIPFGFQYLKLAYMGAAPFGKALEEYEQEEKAPLGLPPWIC